MAESTVTDRRTLPYIPLATLTNFVGKLKKTVVPPVIDASLTRNMSGGMSGALTSALKFLGLIDQVGRIAAWWGYVEYQIGVMIRVSCSKLSKEEQWLLVQGSNVEACAESCATSPTTVSG